MTPGVLNMWAIYDHPKDAPDAFVARRWEIGRPGSPDPVPTHDTRSADTIEELRATFRAAGLTRIERTPGDDPVIVETWF